MTYPNKANTQGWPLLNGVPSVDAVSGNLVITFQPHLSLGADWSGGFLVNIDGTIDTGGQNVVFATAGVQGSVPLYSFGGDQLTAADLVTTGGVIMCFYNSQTRRLQVLGTNI